MTRIYWALGLALVWTLLRDDFTLLAFAIGLFLGLLTLAVTERLNPQPTGVSQVWTFIKLCGTFLASILRANIILARDIIWRRNSFRHAFFKIDSRRLNPAQTVLLGNMISLTPGSLTLDAEEQGQALYVHTLYGDDVEVIEAQINDLADRMASMRSMPVEEKGGLS